MPGRSYKPAPPTFTSPAPGGGSAASPIKVYEHTFNSPYNSYPYNITPPTISSYLTTTGWTNNQTSWSGNGGIIYLPGSSPSQNGIITLTLNVQSGNSLSITSFSILCKSMNNGYRNWSMTINGITVGSGTVNVGNGAAYSTVGGNVTNPVNGLTGTVTVVITLSNATGNGQFRMDNFVLNGYVEQLTSGASNTKDYRYGFNGKEEDDEVKGDGNQQDYGMRIYDPRLGRFLSVDPISKDYPWLTPYQFASNRPIDGVDLDGLEWYYSNNLFDRGWKETNIIKQPPIVWSDEAKQNYYNKLGYLTLQQVHQIQEEAASVQRREERIRAEQEWNAAVIGVLKSRNLFYLAYELSPISGIVNSYNSFSEGNTVGGVLNLALTVGGLSELRGAGLGKFATVNDLFDASKIAETSLSDIWKLTNNLTRGTLIENKLAQTLYKGYEHLGSTVSRFFKYIDFYDNVAQIGISLKSVNATKNFEFKNIMKNIDDLANAKEAGAIVSNGVEKTIKDVRLDIVVPKGYNKRVLKDVEKYAKERRVKTHIFESE